MIRIHMDEPGEFDALLDAEAYRAVIGAPNPPPRGGEGT